jgi:exopolysaccharide biosynthesis polyprenyl glycosylphosphotransferase
MRRSLGQIIFLILADIVMISVSFIGAYYLRFKIVPFLAPSMVPEIEEYLRILVFILIVWMAIFEMFRLYSQKRGTMVDEAGSVFGAVTVAALSLLGFLFLYRGLWFSRQVLIYAWALSLVLLTLPRFLVDWFQSYLYSRGVRIKKTLIIGAGDMGQALAAKITGNPGLGFRIVGFLDDDPEKLGMELCGFKVLGGISLAKEMIKKTGVKEVVIATTKIPQARVLDLITECEREMVEFKIVPGILEIMASRVDTDEVAGIPIVTISEIRLKGLNAVVKRSTDLLFSLILLILLSPLFLLLALLIKITSPGPVFFMQERVGRDGKRFMMFKFRSMVADAEKLLSKIRHLSEVEGHIFKMKKDPRVSAVGRFMRKLSLDELPQLINVFVGEMSLVGPRPPIPAEVEKYSLWHMKRLRTAPGITGLWQVSGRSELPFEDMVRLDVYYIENWSLWLDINILLRTIPTVLFTRGAY